MTGGNRRFLLVRRPQGAPGPDDFRLEARPLPELAQGEYLVRNHFASLDPAIRGWLDDRPSYIPPIGLGDPVRTSTVGVVVESRNADVPVGQWMVGLNAIEEYSLGHGGSMQPIDPDGVPSVTYYLSLFGAAGLTAYFGFLEVCRPHPGETVLVSGAAGAVGSLVGQIARIKGCRVIGIAGGPGKCRRLTDRYGFDAAIDYRGKDEADLAQAIRSHAPDGIDMIFENVGGAILEAGVMNIRPGGRIALCGLISEYNAMGPTGLRNLWQLIVNRASIRGLFVGDYAPRFGEGVAALQQWLGEGRLVFDEHIETGIENTLPAFMRLFDGSNEGKMILKLID